MYKKCIVTTTISDDIFNVYILGEEDIYHMGDWVFDISSNNMFLAGMRNTFCNETTYKILATSNFNATTLPRIPKWFLKFCKHNIVEICEVRYEETVYWVDSVSGEKETCWSLCVNSKNCIKIKGKNKKFSSKDEVVSELYTRVYNCEYTTRNVMRNIHQDSGYLDCYDKMTKNE